MYSDFVESWNKVSTRRNEHFNWICSYTTHAKVICSFAGISVVQSRHVMCEFSYFFKPLSRKILY